MSGLAVGILAVLVGLIAFGSRRWALLATLASVLYVTKGLFFDVGSVSLYGYRVIILAAFVRVVFRKEFRLGKLNGLDYAILCSYAYTTLVFLLRSASGYGTSDEIQLISTMDKVGLLLDVTLGYVGMRGLIEGLDDIRWVVGRFAVLLIPYVAFLYIERSTGQNPLADIGGISMVWAEGDRIRARGSFIHPSLLGTLGASFLPLYGALVLSRATRAVGLLGLSLCVAVILLANSGGPVIMAAVTFAAWCLWILRNRMALVRFSLLALFVLLALAMRAPVWYLPDRLSALVGGDGWHRSYLMQMAFTNLDQWWFAGMPLDLTRDWFPYLVMGAVDITNFYLSLGFDAGLLAIALFIAIFVRAFSLVGSAHKGLPTPDNWLAWGLGAAIAGHLANFLAITYFDQTNFIWLFQLAAVSSLAVTAKAAERRAPAKVVRQFGVAGHPVPGVHKTRHLDR